jgi:hypothetical protein
MFWNFSFILITVPPSDITALDDADDEVPGMEYNVLTQNKILGYNDVHNIL